MATIKKKMKQKIKRAALIIIMAAVIAGMQTFTFTGIFSQLEIQSAYAAVQLPVLLDDSLAAKPGDRDVKIVVDVVNDTPALFEFNEVTTSGIQGASNIRVTPQSGTIAAGGEARFTILVDVSNSAATGLRAFNLIFDNNDTTDRVYLYISDGTIDNPPQPEDPLGPRTYNPAADFSHTIGAAEGFSPGRGNSITFYVLNRGDTAIRNAQFTIELPEGMSVFNASTTSFVGTISIGQRVGRTFSVMVHDDLEGGKAYPITLKVTGIDRASDAVNLENTFYIPVVGTGAGAVRDISIENIIIPAEVAVDEDFTMEFNVRNTGQQTIRNIKAYAEMPEGIINKSNSTFIIDSIGPAETRVFSITMSAREGSNRSFPIKIAVEPLSGSADSGVIRYASVFAAGGGDAARTPQLMIDRYSYGGASVLAGREFHLNMSFVNTSNRRLSNIRATLLSEEGTFVPVDSSNSFFVNSVEAGGQFSRTVALRASPSAEQKTTAITVTMTYEDGGGEFTAQDTISIPVMQVMRLSVDEIVPPFEVYAFTQGFSSLQFYNMGHTTLNNLMITAEGDFDVMQSNSYYVGNMEGGTSDTFSFTFIPRDVGPMEGKVIFTYEDLDGEQVLYEAPFVFMVMEMPVWDDPWREDPQEKNAPWGIIIFGIVLVIAAAGVIAWRHIRKTKLNKKLEIEDEEFNAAFDLEKTGDDK